MAEQITPGYYRHFKGGLYYVVGLARDSEAEGPPLVCYYSVEKKALHYRPLHSPAGVSADRRAGWLDPVDKPHYQGPRFTLLMGVPFEPRGLPTALAASAVATQPAGE